MARSAILQRGKRGNPDPTAAEYGPVHGWRPFGGGQHPSQQIGVYGDAYLNQFPAYYNQPQLHQGVEFLSSAWYTPTVSTLPTFDQTQQPTNIAGGQRFGAPAGAPLGPLTAKGWRSRVTQAQVAQSGASALSWAANLTEG
jgi:hypothetical protein